MYSHLNNIQQLIKIGLPNDMFDYTNNDPYKVVENYFQFCQTNLSERCEEFNIQPALIYIRQKMEVNARAGKIKDHYIIAVNFGTILTLFRLFSDHRKIFESKELKIYSELDENLDVSLDYLLFQLCTQFTYYHELAHLIQKSPIQNTWLQEEYEGYSPENEPYSLERHLFEFDADLHASNYIAFHILNYWERQQEKLKTIENLGLLISLGIAAVYSYFIFLMRKYTKVYYTASTHPHPLIRIFYISDCFIKVCEQNIGKEIKLDPKEIIRNGFSITDYLFSIGANNPIHNFLQSFNNEQQNIENYINQVLIPESKKINNLAMNRNFKVK